MTKKRWQEIQDLFQQVVARPADERSAWLAERCGSDERLRAAVENLLAAEDGAGQSFDPADMNVRDLVSERPPESPQDVPTKVRGLEPAEIQASGHATPVSPKPAIDGYEVTREISHGGQGVVYQAIQTSTKRKVAIKVLHMGTASKSVRRRFEREIELVASLKHPNIVSIFHSGTTEEGRQFAVMDYIRGVPLTTYVREQKPTFEDALKLFTKVCAAVQYAHQRAVIHRDLKPSNILVDSDGEPKVLDFGLAKQIGGPEQTLVSMTGQVVGTLPYMSPEQVKGNPDHIDTRTDVYALGVILYEMLTGAYPYPVVGNMAEVLKHIAETDPTPPSRSWTKGSGISGRSARRGRRGASPIDDELRTITLKTLAKERARRYQSAGDLAADLQRYVAGDPIEAKRDSGWYVLQKTVVRYRVPLLALLTVTIGLVLGLGTVLSMWRWAESERAKAVLAQGQLEEERDRAREARAQAEAGKRQAEQERLRAEHALGLAEARGEELAWENYVSTMALAQSAYEDSASRRLRTLLDNCPAHLRGWEWRRMNWLSDRSQSMPLAGKRVMALSSDAAHAVVAEISDPAAAEVSVWDLRTNARSADLGCTWERGLLDEFRVADGGHRVLVHSEAVEDSRLVVLDREEGSYHEIPRGVLGFSLSRDGELLALLYMAGMTEPRVEVRRADSGDVAWIRAAPDGWAVSFSPSGRSLLVYQGRAFTLLDAYSGSVLMAGEDQYSGAAAFSSDERLLALGQDGGVQIVDLDSGRVAMELTSGPETTAVALGPHGDLVAAGGSDGTIHVWRMTDPQPEFLLRGHVGSVESVVIHEDGTLTSCSSDQTIRTWKLDAVSSRRSLVTGWFSSATPDFTRVLVDDLVLDVVSGRTVTELSLYDVDGTLSPNGAWAVSSSYEFGGEPRVVRYDLGSGTKESTATFLMPNDPIALNDGRVLFVNYTLPGMKDPSGGLYLWDPGLDRPPRNVLPDEGEQLDTIVVCGDLLGLSRLTSEGDRVEVRELDNPDVVLHAYSMVSDETSCLTISQGGSLLAAGDMNGNLRVWDLYQDALLFSVPAHNGRVNAVVVSVDEARIVTAGRDGIRLWDARGGDECLAITDVGPEATPIHLDRSRLVYHDTEGLWSLETVSQFETPAWPLQSTESADGASQSASNN